MVSIDCVYSPHFYEQEEAGVSSRMYTRTAGVSYVCTQEEAGVSPFVYTGKDLCFLTCIHRKRLVFRHLYTQEKTDVIVSTFKEMRTVDVSMYTEMINCWCCLHF